MGGRDSQTIHSIHSSTWYKSGRVVTPPFSTLLTHKAVDGRFKIARMQVSSLAPCSLARDLKAYVAGAGQINALNHAQFVVDQISQAALSDDFELFLSCIRIPYVMQWDNQAQMLDTREQLKSRFDFIAHDLKRRSVTEVFRRVKSVQSATDCQVFATCTTYLLSENVLAAESVTNSMWFAEDASGHWVSTGLLNPRLPPTAHLPRG